jgi:hypothetical protein
MFESATYGVQMVRNSPPCQELEAGYFVPFEPPEIGGLATAKVQWQFWRQSRKCGYVPLPRCSGSFGANQENADIVWG